MTSTSRARPTGSGRPRRPAGRPRKPRCSTSDRSRPGCRPETPGSSSSLARLRERGDVLITYDPNVRPGLLPDRHYGQARGGARHHARSPGQGEHGRRRVALSRPDAGQVARHWLRLGASTVVMTSSADGAEAFTAQGWSVRRPALDVAVLDTVGAGDSFMAGLIGSLISRGQHAPAELARCPGDQLSGALDDAILVASINCERRGNDPPTAADVAAARGRLEPRCPQPDSRLWSCRVEYRQEIRRAEIPLRKGPSREP